MSHGQYNLEYDDNDRYIGCVLSPKTDNTRSKPIKYLSWSTTNQEKNLHRRILSVLQSFVSASGFVNAGAQDASNADSPAEN